MAETMTAGLSVDNGVKPLVPVRDFTVIESGFTLLHSALMADRASSPAAHRATTLLPRWAIRTLLVLATVLTIFGTFAVWANRQMLNTDGWSETSTKLIESPPVRSAVAGYVTEQIYANVDVAGELKSGLPQQLKPLAGPAAGALRSLVEKGVDLALERPLVQELWRGANEIAHAQFVKLIENKGAVVKLPGEGRVVLDLRPVVEEAAKRVGASASVAERIPADVAEVEVLRSNEIEAAQTGVNVLRQLALVLPLLAFALFALAVFLARGRRPQTLVAVGGALLIAGIVVLIGRSLGGKYVVDALARTEAVRPAAESVWSIGTSILADIARATIFVGVPIVLAGLLAGPTNAAVGIRRSLAPSLRDRPALVFGVVGVLLAILFAWGPIEATRTWWGILVIIALSFFGAEMLRRQTAHEFPDAMPSQMPDLRHGIASAAGALSAIGSEARADFSAARARRRQARAQERGETGTGAPYNGGDAPRTRPRASPPTPLASTPPASTPPPSPQAGDLPAQLGRLAELHRSGALTDEEYAAAKQRLLQAPAP